MSAVTGKKIGAVGAQALAKALESNTLKELYLSGTCPIAPIIAVLVVAVLEK
jgi:hypothetical protein